MKTAVIVGAARTPVGKFMGGLSAVAATTLGAVAVREAVRRSGVNPDEKRALKAFLQKKKRHYQRERSGVARGLRR